MSYESYKEKSTSSQSGRIIMEIKPIKTQKDYHTALKKIETLFDAKPDTPEGDRLDVLTTLVEAYE